MRKMDTFYFGKLDYLFCGVSTKDKVTTGTEFTKLKPVIQTDQVIWKRIANLINYD